MSWALRLLSLTRGSEAKIAYAVAGVVMILCWAVVLYSGDVVKSLDEPDFLGISKNLAETGMFALTPGEPTAYRAPGLVFLLTPLSALGAGLMEARLINGVLVALSLILLFQLVRRHSSDFAALLCVIMVSGWPVVIYTASTLYPQTLAAFLLVLTLWLLDSLRDEDRLRPIVLGGVAYGLLVLTIPVVLLLTPVFLIWIITLSKRWLTAVVIFSLVSGAVVSSWTLRNWLAFDSFVPVATSSGYNLLAGNSPEARWNTSLDIRFPDYVYEELTGKNEIERNDIMTKAALREIAADPAQFFSRYVGKFIHWFHFSNQLLSDNELEGGASSVSASARDIILLAAWSVLIIGPLLLRLAMIRKVPIRRLEVLFFALWITAGLAYALFFTRVRFRLPFDWLIISVNAMFLAALIESWLDRRNRH
ncbi:MAG: glycosyltransferase family 39 protein [Paracoccaceae bacterium]|nr:glycosyltransferase family 39 protein [Paracoccaceae bacterium]